MYSLEDEFVVITLCSLSLIAPAYRFVCGQPGGGLRGAEPPIGSFFEITNPQPSRCLTTRCAAISAVNRSLS